jgi:hypothetical protein
MLAYCFKHLVLKLVDCFSFSSVNLKIVLIYSLVELKHLSYYYSHLYSCP